MNKPHVHAALIKAWANDTSLALQCRSRIAPNAKWIDLDCSPTWKEDLEYRIKPEPVVRWLNVNEHSSMLMGIADGANAKLTFKDGKLVAAEVL